MPIPWRSAQSFQRSTSVGNRQVANGLRFAARKRALIISRRRRHQWLQLGCGHLQSVTRPPNRAGLASRRITFNASSGGSHRIANSRTEARYVDMQTVRHGERAATTGKLFVDERQERLPPTPIVWVAHASGLRSPDAQKNVQGELVERGGGVELCFDR